VRLFRLLVCFAIVALAPGPRSTAAQPAPTVTVAELSKRLEGLGSSDAETRRRAAESVHSIGPTGTDAIARVLAKMRETGQDPGVRMALRAADIERATASGEDWTRALLERPSAGVSYQTALTTACLLEALARIGTTSAVRELVITSRDQAGAFKPEIARELQDLGERATAALILTSHDPARDVARFASSELEALGKKVPGDAVQTKSNQVLADVLEAYGATRDMDALGAVLSFVNSARAQVRDAARRSVLGYGDTALPKLREAYTNLAGSPPPDAWSAADVARDLFAKDDRTRLEDVYALMDRGLAAEGEGKHEEAVESFQRVLARQPLFERRAEMVPAFVLLAQSKEDADRQAAEELLRVAARLSPDGPRAQQVASALDYLEGEDLLSRGIEDARLFRRAAQEDPGNVKAHDELARIAMAESRRSLTLERYTEACGGLAAVVCGVVLIAGRSRKKR
jgi:tetratricopeptide (TPR) repeat protein